MNRLRPARFRLRRAPAADSGQAMLEFLIAFPPVLVLILMIMEYSYFVNVNHFTQYAAFAAARSRIVSTADFPSAAALAMVPFADAGALYNKVTRDGTAASAAATVRSKLSTLTATGAYKGKSVTSQDNRVYNSFYWQTSTWATLYDKKDKATTSSDFAYVKTGVCFTYPLRIQTLAPLSAWIMRKQDRSGADATVTSLFGGATNALAPPPPTDYWQRAETIRRQSGIYVVPVIQGCILGKR